MLVESKQATEGYRLNIDEELRLSSVIKLRLAELGFSRANLVRRMRYESTVAKGLRRLDALMRGDLRSYANLRTPLARALDLHEGDLDKAADDTRYALWAREDRAYRSCFTPHGVWETESKVPRPIAVAGMIGAHRKLYFTPTGTKPADWSEEAADRCPSGIPCYGAVQGFWINYTPDCAIRFTRQGEPLAVLNQAVRPGFATAVLGS